MVATTVYKIVSADEWQAAESTGQFAGSAVDLQDGFIHFSTAAQVQATADKHFRGQSGLLLVAVDSSVLGESLRWETSRGGQRFPHLYDKLPVALASSVSEIRQDKHGNHLIDLGT